MKDNLRSNKLNSIILLSMIVILSMIGISRWHGDTSINKSISTFILDPNIEGVDVEIHTSGKFHSHFERTDDEFIKALKTMLSDMSTSWKKEKRIYDYSVFFKIHLTNNKLLTIRAYFDKDENVMNVACSDGKGTISFLAVDSAQFLLKLVEPNQESKCHLPGHRATNSTFSKEPVPILGCSGREGLNPVGESPTMPIARFSNVAILQLPAGNPGFIAWCISPSRLKDNILQW